MVLLFDFLKYLIPFIFYKRAKNRVIVFLLGLVSRGGSKPAERTQVKISDSPDNWGHV